MAEMDAEALTTHVLTVTSAAHDFVIAARPGEGDPSTLALYLEVSGTGDGVYTYDMWFESVVDAGVKDAREDLGDLVVVIPADSVDRLRGATLDLGEQDGEPSLILVNPNTPRPAPGSAPPLVTGDLSGPVAAAVLAVLEREVNPQIAAHGGRADLVGVDDAGIAYLRLSGGCQGCGMAQVTLSQGIAVAIKEGVPEITDIVDVTAHEAGANPYFEGAKK